MNNEYHTYNSVLICLCAAVLRPDHMFINVEHGYHIFTTQSSSVSVLLFYALIALLAAIIILAIILIVCCCAPGTLTKGTVQRDFRNQGFSSF